MAGSDLSCMKTVAVVHSRHAIARMFCMLCVQPFPSSSLCGAVSKFGLIMFTLPPKPFIDDPESPAAKRRAGADESASSEQKRNSAARVFPQKSETDEPWSTGSELTDRWIIDNHVDPAVLEKFALLPKMNRKRIILNCIQKPVQNPDAWITACVRNWQTNETEQRLTRAANQTGGMMSTVAVPREGFQPYSASASGHFSSPHKEAVSTEFPVPGLETFKVMSNPVCQKMMTMWPDRKSDFISTFLSCVDDATGEDRKSTRLNSSHIPLSRMPSSA